MSPLRAADQSAEQFEVSIQDKLSLINEINKIGVTSADIRDGINKKNTFGVHMAHVGSTNPRSTFPIISSHGALTCIILGLYNPVTQNAIMAHFTASTDSCEIEKILKDARDSDDCRLEAHLVGGQLPAPYLGNNSLDAYGYTVILDHIYRFAFIVKNAKNVKIKTSKLGYGTSERLALDSRTGEVTCNFDYDHTFIRKVSSNALLYQSSLIHEKIDEEGCSDF